MKQLFIEGGSLYMGILTGIFIIMVVWAIYNFLPVYTRNGIVPQNTRAKLKHIKTIGSFALVFGIFSQLLGIYQAFGIIEQVGDISPKLFMSGLKISMITTIYGMIIFMISLAVWLVFDFIARKQTE